jgi:hypothetical protein
MKSIKLILLAFTFTVMFTVIRAQEKKPIIILYDNGTWEKIDNKDTTTNKVDITKVWTDFQKAIKDNNKNLILNNFMFPFETSLLLNENPSDKCIRSICDLNGAVSKSKLEANLTKLFDKDLKKSIIEKKADEYLQRKSDKFNSTAYVYEVFVDNSKSLDNRYTKIKYNFYFINNNGKMQIYYTLIHFAD